MLSSSNSIRPVDAVLAYNAQHTSTQESTTHHCIGLLLLIRVSLDSSIH